MTFTPTREQQAVLRYPLRPVRVAAGAGTGKTSTLALRIVHLVESEGVQPEEVLGITFTNKAAEELADRIRVALQGRVEPGREVEIHTYHGFAARLLQEFGALIGVERSSSVVTPTFARQLLMEALAGGSYETLDITSPRVVDKLQKLGADLGDNLNVPDDLLAVRDGDETWAARREIAAALSRYDAEKRRLNVLDYADLVRLAHELVTRHPDVAARVRDRYRVTLLDEYQDTNPSQRELLRCVFGGGFPVNAVGDPDQTIYEWRGASLENFAAFPEHFPDPDGSPSATLPLSLNRRSGSDILALANRLRAEIGGDVRDPLRPLPDAPEGLVGIAWLRTAVEEAEFIADRMLQLRDDGWQWRQMAVLFRKNKDIPLIRDALEAREIPVEVANLGGLLAIPEVTDVYAWLRILGDPTDGPALMRILMGSRFRLGMGDLRPLANWVRGADRRWDIDRDHDEVPRHSLVESVDKLEELVVEDDRSRRALAEFRDIYRELLRDAQGVSLVELVRRILSVSGAWQEVEGMAGAARLSARLNLYRFLDLAEEWSPLEGRPSLHAFLDYLILMQQELTEELDTARLSGEDAVALLTVHRAKGLEWPVVFLPALYQDNFPSKPQALEDPFTRPEILPYDRRLDRQSLPPLDTAMTLEERKDVLRARHQNQEWRVAYVAVTRAARHLYLTGAYWYGAPEPRTTPARPGPLFELARSQDGVVILGFADEPGQRPEALRFEPTAEGAPDPTFPAGWDAGMRTVLEDSEWAQRRAAELGASATYHAGVDEFQQMLFRLPEPPQTDQTQGPLHTSVTSLVTYASCPKRYYWSEVDRLPRRPSAAARRGVEVHRLIELHHRGEVPLDEATSDTYDLTPVEATGDAAPGTDPYTIFRQSRFAAQKPILVEVPFDLRLGEEARVRGRVDAIYEHAPGRWEVVDFKSGRSTEDPAARVQLEAYAVAAHEVDFTATPPEEVRVTFAYLGGELEEVSEEVTASWLENAREHLHSLVSSIRDEAWQPAPSAACRDCDFLRFCAPGRAWVDGSE